MDITLTQVMIAVFVFGIISLAINILLVRKASNLALGLSSQAERIRNFEESVELFEENVSSRLIELDSLLKKQFKELNGVQQSNVSHLKSSQEQHSKYISDTVKESFASFNKRQAAYSFKNKQENLANLEQLTTLVQNLRVDNLVELSNELARHQDLSVENSEFVKSLGDCKVTRIKDKYSGQVTQIYYENNIKRSSDTFVGDTLKYQMFYNATGKPERGLEFNSTGLPIFEYCYDETGEVESQTAFEYDEAGKQVSKETTNY